MKVFKIGIAITIFVVFISFVVTVAIKAQLSDRKIEEKIKMIY